MTLLEEIEAFIAEFGILKNAEDLGRQADTLQAKASQFIAEVQRSSVEMLSAGEASAIARVKG